MEPSLKEQVKQAWESLKAHDVEGGKAQEIYTETVWPLLLKLWQQEPQVFPLRETFEVSIHTLGTSPEATTLAVLGLGAPEVYVLHTPESKRYLDQLRRDVGREIYPVEIDKSDVTRLYKAVGEQVRKHPGKTIALDLTSGTKAMSAGMAAAGYFLQRVYPSLRVSYVDNDAFDATLRKPVAGTEKLILLPNPHEVLGDLDEHLAQELYKAREFGRAADRFNVLKQKTGQGSFDLYAALCEMYQRWYALDFEGALSNAGRLLQFLTRDTYRTHPLAHHARKLAEQRGGLEAVQSLLNARNFNDPKGILWLSATLIFLGDERKERQPVLAGLYFYRALELLLQHRLALHGRDVDAPNLSDLERKSLREVLSVWLEKDAEKIELYGKLGLLAALALLRVIGDSSVAMLPDKEIRGYQGLLQSRNKALLIHGLEVSKKGELANLRELTRRLFAQVCGQAQLSVEPIPLG